MINSSSIVDRILLTLAWPSLINSGDTNTSLTARKKLLQKQISTKHKFHLGRFSEPQLKKLISIDPKNAVAKNRLGIVYAKQGKFDLALSLFQDANNLKRHPATSHNIALVYYYLEDYKNSLSYFKQSLELRSKADKIKAYTAIAVVSSRMNKNDDAIKALNEAVKIDKTLTSLLNLYSFYKFIDKSDEAFRVRELIESKSSPLQNINHRLFFSPKDNNLDGHYYYC